MPGVIVFFSLICSLSVNIETHFVGWMSMKSNQQHFVQLQGRCSVGAPINMDSVEGLQINKQKSTINKCLQHHSRQEVYYLTYMSLKLKQAGVIYWASRVRGYQGRTAADVILFFMLILSKSLCHVYFYLLVTMVFVFKNL